MTRYTIDRIGSVAIAFATERGRQITLSLADGQTVPTEFKPGDEVKIVNHPSPDPLIAMGINEGYYEITHVPSGKILQIMHTNDQFKLEL